MVDTSDEWIMSRIGVKTRHILKGEGVGTSYMGARAVIDLLDKDGRRPDGDRSGDLRHGDPRHVFPVDGQPDRRSERDAKTLSRFDRVGGLQRLSLRPERRRAKFIESGPCKKVVVVGADKMSSIVDYTDRSTCPIFGDGAAAVLLEPDRTTDTGVLDAILHSDGVAAAQHLYMKAGGSRLSRHTRDGRRTTGTMSIRKDSAVFKAAVSNMADTSVEIMERNNLTAGRHPLPGTPSGQPAYHRRNGPPNGASGRKVHDQHRQVRQHDGCHDSALPLGLRIAAAQRATTSILAAFGGGYTWGAVYVKWAYDGGDFSNKPQKRRRQTCCVHAGRTSLIPMRCRNGPIEKQD